MQHDGPAPAVVLGEAEEVAAKDGTAAEEGPCEEQLARQTDWPCAARLLPVICVEPQLHDLRLPRALVQTGWVGTDSAQSMDLQLQTGSAQAPVLHPALLLCQ